MNDIEFKRQEKWYTCGSTCLYMIYNFLCQKHYNHDSYLSIDQIGSFSKTNTQTGTVGEYVVRAFKALGVESNISVNNNNAIFEIKKDLENGNLCLLRTLTFGMKHWVLAYGINKNNLVYLADPASGPRLATLEEVNELIRPRDYEYHSINPNTKPYELSIENMDDIDDENYIQSLILAHKQFSKFSDNAGAYIHSVSNRELSIALVRNNEIVGVYFLSNRRLHERKIDKKDSLKNLNGICGIALGVDENYRGLGYGDILKDEPQRLGYDYIFGEQLKDLNNIKDWLKRRVLFAEYPHSYLTVEFFDGIPKGVGKVFTLKDIENRETEEIQIKKLFY